MPDGSAWCGITKHPESGIGCSYTPGTGKLYKPEPKVVQKSLKEKVGVVKTSPIPKAKPISVKQKNVISKRKINTGQQKMF